MFLAFWYYLHGYVMIEVTGFSVERFVNMAAFRGIYLWDVCPCKGKVRMKVSRQGYDLLEECAKKTGCSYDIVAERGLPARMRRYQKRKILAAGVVFFIAGLYILSSFVWVLQVQGNERISEQDILQACAEGGLKPGAFKLKLNTEKLTEGLLEGFPDISWVSVNIKGTNARIKLVETIPQPEILDKETPIDIVAAKDGVILSVVTEAGTPLVSAGDVVEQGDVLISGEVVIQAGDEEVGREYIKARGKVQAKLWRRLKQESLLQYEEKQFTGEWKRDHSIILRDSVLNVIRPRLSDGLYDEKKVYEKNLAIGDFKFPIVLAKEEYQGYTKVKKTRTTEQAKAKLAAALQKKAKGMVKEGTELLNVAITFQEYEDRVTAEAIFTLSESIDTEKEMEFRRDANDGGTDITD